MSTEKILLAQAGGRLPNAQRNNDTRGTSELPPSVLGTGPSRSNDIGSMEDLDRFFNSPIIQSETPEQKKSREEREAYHNALQKRFDEELGVGRSHNYELGGTNNETGIMPDSSTKSLIQTAAIPSAIYGKRVAANLATLVKEGKTGEEIAQVALKGGRLSQGTARFIYTAEAAQAANQGAKISGGAAKLAGFGATKVLGKAVPVLGAGLAVIDLGVDLHKLGTCEQEDGESYEDYKERFTTARNDFAINASFTAAGAIIGFCLGGPIGAMVGAGIGNLIGSGLKSGGWLRSIGKGIRNIFSGPAADKNASKTEAKAATPASETQTSPQVALKPSFKISDAVYA